MLFIFLLFFASMTHAMNDDHEDDLFNPKRFNNWLNERTEKNEAAATQSNPNPVPTQTAQDSSQKNHTSSHPTSNTPPRTIMPILIKRITRVDHQDDNDHRTATTSTNSSNKKKRKTIDDDDDDSSFNPEEEISPKKSAMHTSNTRSQTTKRTQTDLPADADGTANQSSSGKKKRKAIDDDDDTSFCLEEKVSSEQQISLPQTTYRIANPAVITVAIPCIIHDCDWCLRFDPTLRGAAAIKQRLTLSDQLFHHCARIHLSAENLLEHIDWALDGEKPVV